MSRTSLRPVVVVVVVVGLLLSVAVTVSGCSSDPDLVDGARMPSSSSDFEGENYRDVVDELEAAGFTNVTSQGLGDLITGWINPDGSVKEVDVDGITDFSRGSQFLKSVAIVVYYHSFPWDDEVIEASAEPTEPDSQPEPGARPAAEAEARWLEIMMIDDPLDLLTQPGYDYYAPLHAIVPGWGGSTDDYLRITVQEPLNAEQVKRLGINVLNLIGPDFRDIQGVIFTDSTGLDHNFFRFEAPGADL